MKFGGNQSGKIIGTRTIGNSSISINNVWLVDGLEHNLLSISQFCDNDYDVIDESIISIFYIIFNLVLSRFKSILFY